MVRHAFVLLFAAVLSWGSAAQAAPPPIEAYGKLPAMEFVRLSPSGERFAFIGNDGEKRRLFVSTTSNQPLASGDVGTLKVRDLEWAGEDHLLVRSSATIERTKDPEGWKSELLTVSVLNVTTGHLLQVFGPDNTLNISNYVNGIFGTALEAGRWYGYFGGQTIAHSRDYKFLKHPYPDLYRVDLDSGEASKAATGEDGVQAWLIGSSGGIAARSRYNSPKAVWQLIAGGGEGKTLAEGRGEFAGLGTLDFGRMPDTILFDIPDEKPDSPPESYGYREISLSGDAIRDAPPTGNMARPLVDPVTRLWLGEVLENDTLETILFAPALAARWKGAQKAFPKNSVHLESWSENFDRLIVFTEGNGDSGTHWLVDIPKRSADPLGEAYPTIKDDDMGPVRMVDWRAADGLSLHGVLTLPPRAEAKSLPVVVLPHGGPEARDYPFFSWWAQAFASRGYAVFQPNFRGSSGYGITFRNAGFGEWGRKMQTDISDGVAELARAGIVDPKRACIVGASYGGYAALAGVTIQQGLYRCAVSVDGVADPREFIGKYSNIVRHPGASLRFWNAYIGDRGLFGASLDDISPNMHADRADAPILLIHGKDDSVVSIKQSEAMEAALKSAGKPVEFIKMENEDHWLSREATRVEMLKAAVSFVEKNNPAN